ncbi:MAG: PAS-domain containing protein [Alphaproteobacteria bacterium]|nr:PAS-domain containing protein [Alphaproteobacteria bacterium]
MSSSSLVTAIHPAADGVELLTIVALIAVTLGAFVSILAVKLYLRLRDTRRQAQTDAESARGQIAFRDALLSSDGEAVTVLGSLPSLATDSAERANALLKSAMEGPDSRRVTEALSMLIAHGTPFRFTARTDSLEDAVALRGSTVWNRAVAFVRRCAAPAPVLDYLEVLDTVPVPVWIRGADMALRWGNKAFLNVADATSLQNALATNASLQRSELDLAAAAVEVGQIEAIRFALVDGERRAFTIKFVRLADASVVGVGVDMTEKSKAEGRLRLHIDATMDMLEGIPFGVAVFAMDKRLESWNARYARIWGFQEGWLESRPSCADVLDRLRETRQLPEQQDYAAWKTGQLALFEHGAHQREEFWHLAQGRSLKVTTRPHLLGGVVVMVEDITETLALETSFKMLLQVQRATLDTVEDAMAVFAPDGRLVLFNRSFAAMWRFAEAELDARPHFTRLAQLAEARLGRDAIWSIVGTGIQSAEPERCNEWGKATRADGRSISLSMSRLPNGATIATFCDLTDLERFQQAAKASHAAA